MGRPETEGILEPSLIEGRFRIASIDFELTCGWGLQVNDPRRGWVDGTVEYSHQRGAYYFTEELSIGSGPTLAEIADRRLSVRLP